MNALKRFGSVDKGIERKNKAENHSAERLLGFPNAEDTAEQRRTIKFGPFQVADKQNDKKNNKRVHKLPFLLKILIHKSFWLMEITASDSRQK